MRLTNYQLQTIKDLFVKHFSSTDRLWLFGSRVDDLKKGGDIDLYVETDNHDTAAVLRQQIAFLAELKIKIGDQKIDLVINCLAGNIHLPIYDVARSTGVMLL